MTIQRRLLHAMLGLLALAALAGISTIFFPGGEFIGRVAGTLSFAAIAIALTIPASKKLGIQSERTAGLITLLSIVIAFSLSFISLWADFVVGSLSWQLPVTTLAYIACAIPALAFLAILKTPRGRISGLTGVAFSAIVFLCCLFAIWLQSESFSKTTALLAAAALPICACLYGELTDRRYWRWIGVLTGAAAIFMGIIGIWFISGGKPTNIIHCLIVSTVIGGCNILLRLSLPQSQRWLAIATTCTLIATGICGIYVNYLIDLASNTIDSEFVTRSSCRQRNRDRLRHSRDRCSQSLQPSRCHHRSSQYRRHQGDDGSLSALLQDTGRKAWGIALRRVRIDVPDPCRRGHAARSAITRFSISGRVAALTARTDSQQ